MMWKPGYSSVKVPDKRPRYDHDMEVLMMQICFNNFDVKIKFVGYVPRSCD